MSTTKLFRAGLIATVGVAGLTLTANAQSRYGSVYDYESGQNCGQACVPAAPAVATPAANSRYGAPVTAAPTYNQAPVYVDCVQAGTCAPQPAVVYTQPAPAPVYTPPVQTYTQTAQMAPLKCPAGTTAQSDGTCMQTGSTYPSGSTYSSGTTSTYSAPTMSMEPVNCPAGTTAQPDGTCMQGGTVSSGVTMPGTFSQSPTISMDPVNCPAGTTAQPDGTCMQGGTGSYTGSTVELYTGDATTSSGTTYGYGSDGSYGPSDYLPIRK